MVNQRVARGMHTAEASRILPRRRGERVCAGDHKTDEIKLGEACPLCGAMK